MISIEVRSGAVEKQRIDAIVLPMLAGRGLTESGERLRREDAESREVIRYFLRRMDITGEFGQIAALYQVPGVLADRVVFVGVGEERKLSLNRLRELGARLGRWLDESGVRDAAVYLPELQLRGDVSIEEKTAAIAEGIWLGTYRFDKYKSDPKRPHRPLRSVQLMVPARRFIAEAQAWVDFSKAACAGVYLARDVANEPANVCTPSWLAEQAEKLAEEYEAISVEIWDRARLEEAGMRGILAVAQGSRQEPRLIVLRYDGGSEGAPVAIVGKGLTFDSGGVCVKPAKGMDEMKFDMCGAAAVLGIFKGAAEAELETNLLGVIPAVENMMGGAAYKPGDVIRAYNGTTIEVVNTDAEGRIVLADALAWAAEQHPAAIVDLATLTGACVVALGDQAAGLMGNDRGLVRALQRAGERCGDRAWELPMYEEYQEKIKSEIADIKNIGDGGAGPITAACFLSRFVGRARWAHLDIAGVAWTTKPKPLARTGATGAGVRLMLEYLAGLEEA